MNRENDSGAENAQTPRISMLAAHTSVAATRIGWRRQTGATGRLIVPAGRWLPSCTWFLIAHLLRCCGAVLASSSRAPSGGCRLARTLKGCTGAGHHLEVPARVEFAEPR